MSEHPVADARAYLQESAYCDIGSQLIARAANNLARGRRSDREKAVSVFHWVRDHVKYELGLKAETASATLRSRSGSCSNKANLAVALLRVLGIPAGFHVMAVKTREYFGCLCTPRFSQFMSERSFHVYGAVCIGGRWLKIDPSDDIELSRATRHLAVQATPVAFDGCADACLHIEPVHIIADSTVPAVSVDALFSKKIKVPACAIEVMNQYLEYLRRNGLRYRHPAEAEHDFFSWLAVSRPTLHERFAELERQAACAAACRRRGNCGMVGREQ